MNSTTERAAAFTTVDGAKKASPQLAVGARDIGSREMFALIREFVRPYTGWLIIVFIAMLIETAMSLASPWPLKVVIDSVLGSHPLPDWLRGLKDLSVGGKARAQQRQEHVDTGCHLDDEHDAGERSAHHPGEECCHSDDGKPFRLDVQIGE